VDATDGGAIGLCGGETVSRAWRGVAGVAQTSKSAVSPNRIRQRVAAETTLNLHRHPENPNGIPAQSPGLKPKPQSTSTSSRVVANKDSVQAFKEPSASFELFSALLEKFVPPLISC
jgi:hypothetical protein